MSALLSLFAPKASAGEFAIDRPEMWSPNSGGWMRRTMSGERVSPGRALTLSAWFACARVIAEDIGKLPFLVYRRLPNGGKERAIDHTIYRLLRTNPNPETNAGTLRETMTGWAESWGNAFAEIQRDGMGNPCGVDDCAGPGPIACRANVCQAR